MDPQASNADDQAKAVEPGLRASDADRDRAALVLGEALADGRLTAAEHAERVDLVYVARTRADLVPLIDDLPVPGGAAGCPARIVAVFGGATRRGTWQVPAATTVVAVFGGANVDLRDAILPGQEITLRAVAVFGGVSVMVPPGIRVIDSGRAVFGARNLPGDSDQDNSAADSRTDAPVLRLQGACVFGSVSIRREPR